MSRAFACLALLVSVALTGCGSISTAPMPSASVRLTPNPVHIYVAPFNTEVGKWIIAREGVDNVDFRQNFQTQFTHILVNRLDKLAPTEQRWVNDLPDHGWMVAGEFMTVDQGSRALRASIGDGFGHTTMQTQVYVYDLSVSKTQYVLSFRTGVPNPNTGEGAGSGGALSGLSDPVYTPFGLGSGLKQDTTRTANSIADILAQYL